MNHLSQVQICFVAGLILGCGGTATPEGQGAGQLAGPPALVLHEAGGEPFFRIRQIVEIPGGGYLVASSSNPSVVVLGPAGELKRRLGRPGRGPGEFLAINGVSLIDPDTVLVFDGASRRLSTFTFAGELVEIASVSSTSGRQLSGYVLAASSSERVLLVPDAVPAIANAASGVFVDSVPLLLFSRNGAFIGSLGPTWQIELYGDSRGTMRRPFGYATAVAVADELVFVASGSEPEVEIWTLDGKYSGSVVWQSTPSKLDQSAVTNHIRHLAKGIQSRKQRRIFTKWLRQMPWPDAVPHFGRILVDASTRTLLVELVSSRATADTITWVAMEFDGHMSGRYFLPRQFRPHVLRSGFVSGVWKDEFGVEYVHRYALFDADMVSRGGER